MKKSIIAISIFASSIALLTSCSNKKVSKEPIQKISKEVTKRVGMVIKLKPDKVKEYKELHAPSHPGVRNLLIKYNIRNFSIFLHKLEDGNFYEFGYYEYTGDDFKGDMEKLANEPRNKEWVKICAPMQIPLEGQLEWAKMEQIYYNN